MNSKLSVGCDIIYKADSYFNDHQMMSHDFYEIYVHESGNISYMTEDFQIDMIPGNIIIVPPYRMHKMFPMNRNASDEYKCYIVNISRDFINGLGAYGFCLLDKFRKTYREHGYITGYERGSFEEIKLLLSQTISVQGRSDEEELFIYRSNITHFILRLMTQLKEKKNKAYISNNLELNKYRQIPSIIQYVNDNFTTALNISDIATKFDISESYVMHSFKKYTGISLYQYILNKRISLARELISSNLPFVNIQKICGFADYQRFHKAFTDSVGMSPKMYRNEILNIEHINETHEILNDDEIFDSDD